MILQRMNLVGIAGSTLREWVIPGNSVCLLLVEIHEVKKAGWCWSNSTFLSVTFPLYFFLLMLIRYRRIGLIRGTEQFSSPKFQWCRTWKASPLIFSPQLDSSPQILPLTLSLSPQCIRRWLKQHSSCPICRVHALLPEDFPELPAWNKYSWTCFYLHTF